MTNDPHAQLLTKAFGDLNAKPFAWCFDEPAEIEQPVEGETYISSYSELLHAMTNGAMGTPPQRLRHYEPQQPQK